jgi:uncharacterized integral membrane protein
MAADSSQTLATVANSDTHPKEHSRVGTAWVGLFVFTLIMLLLLIFIVQNSTSVRIHYFGASGTIGFGVALLLAAVAGSIMTLLIGSIRIVQLKLSSKHHKENN